VSFKNGFTAKNTFCPQQIKRYRALVELDRQEKADIVKCNKVVENVKGIKTKREVK
jgi:hypothetical protein